MSWLLYTFAVYPPIKEPSGIAIVPILRVTELMRQDIGLELQFDQ